MVQNKHLIWKQKVKVLKVKSKKKSLSYLLLNLILKVGTLKHHRWLMILIRKEHIGEILERQKVKTRPEIIHPLDLLNGGVEVVR